MTVKQLIDKLISMKPETLVVVPGFDHSYRIAFLCKSKAEVKQNMAPVAGNFLKKHKQVRF